MTHEQAKLELLIFRTYELEANQGRETAFTRAVLVAVTALEAMPDEAVTPDPTRVFVDEMCELSPGASVECASLFVAWCSWAASRGHKRPEAHPVFTRNLTTSFPNVRVSRPRVGGKQVRHYEGIALKTPAAAPPWEANLESFLTAAWGTRVTIANIAAVALRIPPGTLSRADEMRVADALKRRGYIRVDGRLAGRKAKFWQHPEAPVQPSALDAVQDSTPATPRRSS